MQQSQIWDANGDRQRGELLLQIYSTFFFFLKKEAQNCSLGASGAFKNDD